MNIIFKKKLLSNDTYYHYVFLNNKLYFIIIYYINLIHNIILNALSRLLQHNIAVSDGILRLLVWSCRPVDLAI